MQPQSHDDVYERRGNPSANFVGEFSQILPQLIPYLPKYFKVFFLRPDNGRRIFETVMQLLSPTEKDGTRFAGVVADRDNIVEELPAKFVDVL